MVMYKKVSLNFLIASLLTLLSLTLKAQESSRFFYGGNIGLSVSEYFDLNINPRVGYYLTPNLALGVTAKYEYINYKGDYEPFKENIYGGGVFAQYDITSLIVSESSSYGIFAITEYQHLYVDTKWVKTSYSNSSTDDKWYLGGGVSVSIGGHAKLYTYITYDILKAIKNESNRYNKPIVNVGVQF